MLYSSVVHTELADTLKTLKTLDIANNPLSDKKLLKLAASSIQAKPILKHVRGGSKTQAKKSAPLPPRVLPARLFQKPCDPDDNAINSTQTSSKKKGKNKGSVDHEAPMRHVLMSRTSLSVRPYTCVCLVPVVDGSGFFFAPEVLLGVYGSH